MATDSITDPERPRLSGETLDRIRARLATRANLGVDPESPSFLDALPGSIFADLVGPVALELDEFYDFAEIVAQAAIPGTSYGTWLDDWAESLGLERRDVAYAGGSLRFTGTPGAEISPGQQVTTEAPPEGDPVAFYTPDGGVIGGGGSIDLPVAALVAGAAGNVAAGTVTVPALEIDGVSGVTNPAAMTGGADVESDELLSARVGDALGGVYGSGTQDDYRRWGLAYPGIGFVTVRPAARGAGTVDVYVTDLNNDPMPDFAVAGFQAVLCPLAGAGLGLAPINHDALVLTPDSNLVIVAAVIAHDDGYSLDGDGGTRATRALIVAALAAYINGLDVGEDVVRSKVIAAIVDVVGVADVSGLEINGDAVAATIAIPNDAVAALATPPALT